MVMLFMHPLPDFLCYVSESFTIFFAAFCSVQLVYSIHIVRKNAFNAWSLIAKDWVGVFFYLFDYNMNDLIPRKSFLK